DGESIIDFDSRIQSVRAKIISQFEGETVIVVSHVMPIRGFLKNALQAHWPAYWRTSVAPCSITALRFWGEEAAEVSFVNYSGHL
ncbi:MAG: histidine phosphatase family protein, partial [Rhodoluna sp.]